MPGNVITRLRPAQYGAVCLDALYGGHGGHGGDDGYHQMPFALHSRQTSLTASRPGSVKMACSPASVAAGPTFSGTRIGRPPQWTISRSRKLARLYLYSTLSIERIIRVLEDDGFNPRYGLDLESNWQPKQLTAIRKNSAQKTIHKMLDNDPRYLRPESRVEMTKRINSLSVSPIRRKRRKRTSGHGTAPRRGWSEVSSFLRQSPVTR